MTVENRLSGQQKIFDFGSSGPSAPCLIGRYDVKKRIPPDEPPYFLAWKDSSESVYSLDNVRVSLRFASPDDASRFIELLRAHSLKFPVQEFVSSPRPGRFRFLFTLPLSAGDDCPTVSFGLGLFDGRCREHIDRGFLDFNPNKCAFFPIFWDFLHFLGRWTLRGELVRWDLAVDLPVSRSALHLFRVGKRVYRLDISNSVTEYLGARNSVGRFKLYDKAAELGFSGVELSRAELTLGPDFSRIEGLWPLFGRVGSRSLADFRALSPVYRGFVTMAQRLVDAGLPVEDSLRELEPHMRPRIRRLLCSDPILLCEDAAREVFSAAVVFSDAGRWCVLSAGSFG